MLDQLSQRSDALYARAVRPSHEGQLRPETQQHRPADLTQSANEAVQQQRAARLEQRRETADQHRQVHAEEQRRHSRAPGQASQVADKLLQQVQRAKQDSVRHVSTSRSNPERAVDYGQRQKLDRTYVVDFPVAHKRMIDEIV